MSTITLRRLRSSRWIRELVQEYRVHSAQFIQPLFVVDGLGDREMVPGLKGVWRETTETLLRVVESDLKMGIKKFLLFGVPREKKENQFSGSFLCSQIQALRRHFGKDFFLITDVCLCSMTAHGHCGILESHQIHNQATVSELAQLALSYAQAGADCVAPSDMMDGRVGAIRTALDQGHLQSTLILSYSAKFHSRFYGPFRLAADSAPRLGTPAGGGASLKDRATYQLDPATPRDAYLSSLRDVEEGADILMVKPGLPYLDVLFQLSQQIKKPWAVYQTSGEYASIEVLAEQGLMNGPQAQMEAWTAFIRAGASMIISYGARLAPEYLKGCE